jgi:hypothetical protein
MAGDGEAITCEDKRRPALGTSLIRLDSTSRNRGVHVDQRETRRVVSPEQCRCAWLAV